MSDNQLSSQIEYCLSKLIFSMSIESDKYIDKIEVTSNDGKKTESFTGFQDYLYKISTNKINPNDYDIFKIKVFYSNLFYEEVSEELEEFLIQ